MDSIKPLGDWSDKHTLDLKFASRAA
jgi:hypothetical protein